MKINIKKLLIILVLLFPAVVQASCESGSDMRIERNGFTWTLDRTYQCGQFANGDYYVLDQGSGVSVVSISPAYINGRNGSMINPDPTKLDHGYDSRAAGYVAGLNVAIGLSQVNPLDLSSGDMLISATSRDPSGGGDKSYVDKAAVLTVQSSRPPDGSFRPAYCDRQRVMYNTSQLDYSILQSLEPVASTPSLASVEAQFENVWLDHMEGWQSVQSFPVGQMPHYGREFSGAVSEAGLMLNLNFSDQEKERLMTSFVQLGIDLYGIAKNPGTNNRWANDGGIFPGRKFPILFASIALGNQEMQSLFAKTGDYLYSGSYGPGNAPPDYFHFHEDDQTFYVAQEDIDVTNSDAWSPDSRSETPQAYSADLLGMPEWAIRHSTAPRLSDASWTTTYRLCCTAMTWAGFVLSTRMLDGGMELWNHKALFDYQDRYVAISNGGADPFGYSVNSEAAGWAPYTFQNDMWQRYRSQFDSTSPRPDPSCSDNIQNQEESGIDCGDPCPSCQDIPEGCLVSDSSFQNHSIVSQNKDFRVSFTVTPNGANIDAVTALGDYPGSTWSDYAMLVRFNASGNIDIRNGSTYSSQLSYPYHSGGEYLIEMDVDMSAKTYDVYVTNNGNRTTLAQNYSFRTEQQDISQISYLGYNAVQNSHNTCEININGNALSRADVDGNLVINSTDALLTLRRSLNLSMNGTTWRSETGVGDINCDNSISSTDALLILRNSLGLDIGGSDWCG